MDTTGAVGGGGERSLATLFTVPGVHSGDRRHIPVHRPQVERAALLVREARLVERLAAWRAEDGHDPAKGGRPSDFTDAQVLTLLVLLALEGQSLHATLVRDLIQYRLTRGALEALGVNNNDPRWLPEQRARYARLWRAVHRVLDVMDPHPDEQRHKRYTYKEWAAVLAARDTDLEDARLERLHEFANALVWTTVEALPSEVRARWDGTIAVDGTHIPLVKRGMSGFGGDNRDARIEAERLERGRRNGKQPARQKQVPLAERFQDEGSKMANRKVSSAPYGGWYTRNHEYLDRPDGKPETKWALDAQLAFMGHPGPGGDFPNLVLGMNLDKPARQPRTSAMKALSNVLSHDLPRGYVVGDRDYFPKARPEDWNIPLRKAGYEIVGDLIRRQTGVQDGYEGAILVDSNWYCPGMPKEHKEATTQFHAAQKKLLEAVRARQQATRELEAARPGDDATPQERSRYRLAQAKLRRLQHTEEQLTEEFNRADATWRKLLEYRRRYLLRPREARRDNGSRSFKCPASGPGATVTCDLKPTSAGTTRGSRTAIRKKDLPSHPGKVCTNHSGLTIPVTAAAKHVQELVWQSEEWKDAFGYPRAMNEARNGWLKDVTGGSIAETRRRLMRGFAAQVLLLGLMIAAENIRAIEAFLRIPDQPRVPRKPRRSVRVRWNPEEDDYEWSEVGEANPNAPPLAA